MSQTLRDSRECANGTGLDRLWNSRSTTTFHANCAYASVVAEHGIVQAPCEVRSSSGGSCVGDAELPGALRRIGAGIGSRELSQCLSARIAELPTFGIRRAAARAGQCRNQGRGAFA